MEFKTAKLDTAATVISAFTTVFLAVMAGFFIVKVPIGIIFAAGMMSIVVFSYLLAPRRYRFEGSKLVIEKVSGKKIVIDIADIKGYSPVADFRQLKPIRSFGNGGLFGYYGLFSTREYGTINCQLTRLKKIFLIETIRGYYVVSPEDADRFGEYMHSTISGMTGKVLPAQPLVRAASKPASLAYLLIPDLIMAITIIMVILWYPQLPDKLATHFNFQGVADGWSPKTAFIWMGIVPPAVIFAFNTILFVILRSHYHDPHIPAFLVLLFSLIQAFLVFVTYDICWFNTRGVHIVPIHYAVIVFLGLVGIFFWVYYNRIRKPG
ncbi:MAG TPA: PH domain-containing protein [bacterium]